MKVKLHQAVIRATHCDGVVALDVHLNGVTIVHYRGIALGVVELDGLGRAGQRIALFNIDRRLAFA